MAANNRTRKQYRTLKASATDGMVTNMIISSGLALFGLLVTFGLVWWQVIEQPKQTSSDLQREQILNQYVHLFNGRIADLQGLVDGIATASSTIEAMTNFDPEAGEQISTTLTSQHPQIVRMDLIEKGTAEVDLNAAVPISFAALDLIRRAETKEFVGPEVSLNQRNLIYAAKPVTANGMVAGILLVVFNSQYFLGPLSHFDSSTGNLQVVQKFDGAPNTTVMQWGDGFDDEKTISTQLLAPHWSLSLRANPQALAGIDTTSQLLVPALVAIVVVFAAIFLGFSRFSRLLTADADRLTEFTIRVIRGRPVLYTGFNLSIMREVATALSPFAQTHEPTNPDEQTASEDESSLLEGLDLPDSAELTPKKAPPRTGEFLEVTNIGSQNNFGIEVSEQVGPLEMGLELDSGIFRAYDIRGITTTNLTEDVVYWIGRAFGSQAASQDQNQVAVGWDGRHSSEPLMQSLTRGLTESGVDVFTIGQVPTPLLYYATFALETGTGIMITGSHNPPEYNGLKMMIDGVTLAEEKIQALYQRLINNDLIEPDNLGNIDGVSLDDSYVDEILADIAIAQPLKVVVDCGNGVAGHIAPRLLTDLGCEVIPLYCEVDGDFPNHHPDPAEPENLADLITVVQAENADLGLAFDGDGDRLGVVTNSGEIVWPDKLIMLFAQDIVSRNPGADIIYDVKCSRHLNGLVSELGGRPIMWKTGHSHMKAKIKETGALLAGEFSGHICFAERWYGFDDALYSAVRLLEIVGAASSNVDDLFAQFPTTVSTPEIKINTSEEAKFEIMARLEIEGDFGTGTLTNIDGIRVDFEDGWGLIRSSNTSPVLSLRFEADNDGALTRIKSLFQQQLNRVDDTLSF